MPSEAMKLFSKMRLKENNYNSPEWMDSFPRCRVSGIGTSQNQMYREDGTPYSEREYEDCNIYFGIGFGNNTFLYGIFDGHNGVKAANFASQRMLAELSFEQLEGKRSEQEVKEVFRQAFISVENSFLESIDPKIAERTGLLDKIPDNITPFEAAQAYAPTFNRLTELEYEIGSGTTAAVALLHHDILYVGNVGNVRALICQKDKQGVLRVKQLSTDHTTTSHDELQRLSDLGLDKDKIRGAKLGGDDATRCIGNFLLKGGYKDFDIISASSAEPVICEPSINSVKIDESCSFMLLMSDGLYKSYEEATGSEHVNKDIATMIVEQFAEQPTLTSVAQTVVDKVVRLHHDAFLTQKGRVASRDDITLLIRNFHFHFPAAGSSAATALPYHLTAPLHQTESTLRQDSDEDGIHSLSRGSWSGGFGDSYTMSTESSDSSHDYNPSLTQLTLDDGGRIRPYVSFEGYFKAVDEAIAKQVIPPEQVHIFK